MSSSLSGFISILLVSYLTWSGGLDSSDVLLLYSAIYRARVKVV